MHNWTNQTDMRLFGFVLEMPVFWFRVFTQGKAKGLDFTENISINFLKIGFMYKTAYTNYEIF